jgi:flagellar biosynthesis protein FlhB
MAEQSAQDKTEKPTPKRLKDARKKGQVAHSREAVSVMILLSAVCVFHLAGPGMYRDLLLLLKTLFRDVGSAEIHSPLELQAFLAHIFFRSLLLLLPLFAAILVAGIAANVIQVGFLFTGESLTPKLSKLNPVNGMKRLLSTRSMVELVKSLLKILLVGVTAYLIVRSEYDKLPSLISMDLFSILSRIGSVSLRLCLYIGLILIALALLDYRYQRWRHEKDLKMSKQEVREELKQREGDPAMKGRIRKIQIEMSRRRMMEKVLFADVILTNPTHLAIALQYDADKMIAPRVVAKGADLMALRIREVAERHRIPIVENKPLARALFKAAEIGEYVPVDLYRAVAEVLAYVYSLKRRKEPA